MAAPHTEPGGTAAGRPPRTSSDRRRRACAAPPPTRASPHHDPLAPRRTRHDDTLGRPPCHPKTHCGDRRPHLICQRTRCHRDIAACCVNFRQQCSQCAVALLVPAQARRIRPRTLAHILRIERLRQRSHVFHLRNLPDLLRSLLVRFPVRNHLFGQESHNFIGSMLRHSPKPPRAGAVERTDKRGKVILARKAEHTGRCMPEGGNGRGAWGIVSRRHERTTATRGPRGVLPAPLRHEGRSCKPLVRWKCPCNNRIRGALGNDTGLLDGGLPPWAGVGRGGRVGTRVQYPTPWWERPDGSADRAPGTASRRHGAGRNRDDAHPPCD